jgi:hypothetical protein
LRFVWCWAIAPLIVLSIPHGKHHHYLVPFLAPWAILAAFGLIEIGRWLRAGGKTLAVVMTLLLAGYCLGSTFLAARTDHTIDDTAFLRRAAGEEEKNIPLFINAKLGDVGNLDFFRIQFYSRADAKLLHNLSYLRDQNITAARVYVITRARDEAKTAAIGHRDRLGGPEHQITRDSRPAGAVHAVRADIRSEISCAIRPRRTSRICRQWSAMRADHGAGRRCSGGRETCGEF